MDHCSNDGESNIQDSIVWLFRAVPWVCLQFAIVVFPDYIYLLFLNMVPQTEMVINCRVLYHPWQLLLFIYQNKECRIRVALEHMCLCRL